MLFKNFDFDNSDNISAFTLAPEKHLATWEHYYQCYNYALQKIFEKGLTRNYAFNCQSRPVLFLMRHSLELCLKRNLELNGHSIPTSHKFKDLIAAFPDQTIIPKDFITLLELPIFEGDGSSLRYYKDKLTGQPYFDHERIEVARIVDLYNSVPSSEKFPLGKISESFNYSGRKEAWDLTFHMAECRNLGHIRGQYDETIELLIESVIMDGSDVNLLYLPLLFLTRHSLEIALKRNINEVQAFSTLIKSKDYGSEHSLSRLYNCYTDYLDKVGLDNLPIIVQEQYQQYRPQYDELNELVHVIDTNSRFFRYPVDKENNPMQLRLKKDSIVRLLKLYYFTDPFITFTNVVLEEEGLLK